MKTCNILILSIAIVLIIGLSISCSDTKYVPNDMKFVINKDITEVTAKFPSGKTLTYDIPPPTYVMKANKVLLSTPPDQDAVNGPDPNTKSGEIITEIGGNISKAYKQYTTDSAYIAKNWRGNASINATYDSLIGSPPENCPNSRLVLYSYDPDKVPKGGYKIFLFFEFVQWGYDSSNFYQSTTQPHSNPAVQSAGVGFFDLPGLFVGKNDYFEIGDRGSTWDGSKAYLALGNRNGAASGYHYRNRLFQYLVSNGYCIISYSVSNMSNVMNWFFSPGTDDSNPANTIWPGPEATFLKRIIGAMYDGRAFSLNPSDSKDTDLKLNMDKLVVGGWSAGGHMSDRCINEFPKMKTYDGKPFPKIRAAWLLGSGSYACYATKNVNKIMGLTIPNNCGWTTDTQNRGGSIGYPESSPTNAESIKLTGCCPAGFTEARYHNKEKGFEWKNHPAVLLTNSLNDDNADPNGTVEYSKTLYKNKKKVDDVIVVNTFWSSVNCNNIPIYSPVCQSGNKKRANIAKKNNTCGEKGFCISHTYFPEMILAVTAFFEYHTK